VQFADFVVPKQNGRNKKFKMAVLALGTEMLRDSELEEHVKWVFAESKPRAIMDEAEERRILDGGYKSPVPR
jgi:hypothetical protein